MFFLPLDTQYYVMYSIDKYYAMQSINCYGRRDVMDAQLRKGLLEYCLLAELSAQDSYGYQIIKDVSEYIDISESTLYPILRRLESDDKVNSYNTEYNNRIRKYYSITQKGREALAGFLEDKEKLIKVLEFIAGGDIHG